MGFIMTGLTMLFFVIYSLIGVTSDCPYCRPELKQIGVLGVVVLIVGFALVIYGVVII
jgi:hypothetical protein